MQSTFCFAFKGKVVDTSNEPIIAATISVYTNDSVMQTNAITDTLGIYNLSNIQVFYFSYDFILPLIEEQLFVMLEILLATVSANITSRIESLGKFGHYNQHLLSI